MARPFYGRVVVAGAFLVLFVAYGTQYAFGVFFAALVDEFGWTRASLAGAFSLYAFAYCIFGFPAGRLTDRWGPRVVIATGGVFLGAALTGMALVTRLWQPYVLYGLVAAIGMGSAYVPCNATVVKWFARHRGLAVGLASSGASVGTFALPPLGPAPDLRRRLALGVRRVRCRRPHRPQRRRDLHAARSGSARSSARRGFAGGRELTNESRQRGSDQTISRNRSVATRPRGTHAGVLAARQRLQRDLDPRLHPARPPRAMEPRPRVLAARRRLRHQRDRRGRRRRTAGHGRAVRSHRPAHGGRDGHGAASNRFRRVRRGGRPHRAVRDRVRVRVLVRRDLDALHRHHRRFLRPRPGRHSRRRAVRHRGSMAAWGPLLAGAVYDATGTYRPAFALAAVLNVVAIGLLLLCRPPKMAASAAA